LIAFSGIFLTDIYRSQ